MILMYDQMFELLTQGCDLHQVAVFQVHDPIEVDDYGGEVERREIMDVFEGKQGMFPVLVEKIHKTHVGHGQSRNDLASTDFLQRH